MQRELIKADAFKSFVCLVKNGSAGSFINAAALHADQTVLNDIDNAYAVGTAELVKLENDVLGTHLFAVDSHGAAFFKVDGHISGNVGSINGGNAHLKEALFLVLRLVAGVFQVKTFVGKVPEVLILGIVGFSVYFKRYIVCFGVVDLFVTALDVPLTPGSDDGHIGSKVLNGKLETNLIVALAGASVTDSVGAFLQSDLHKALGDAGAGVGSAEKIIFINGTRLHGGDDIVVNIFIGEVENIELGGAGFDGFFL